jgi:aspartate dehydrogenase
MASSHRRLKLCIVGCGAIGSRIAISTTRELKDRFMVCALYDAELSKAEALASRLHKPSLARKSLSRAILGADIVVEAVNTSATREIMQKALRSRKNILVMSVGRLLDEGSLFSLARKFDRNVLIPSGAIAGLDAIKAARLAGITSATLTTTKPPRGFKDNTYLSSRGIDPLAIKKDTVIFDGKVKDAVSRFPQNINVAAALSLAIGDMRKLQVRIVASPKAKCNVHEISIKGACGRLTIRVENEACPDNPKTSYLAVLSAIATLKQYGERVKVGT